MDEVLADDPGVDGAGGHVLRDIVVARVEQREREVAAGREEALVVALELEADGVQQS